MAMEISLMIKNDLKIKGAEILNLGITFKENCPDIRNSKAIDVIEALKDYGTNVTVCDPWANPAEVEHEYGIPCYAELPTCHSELVEESHTEATRSTRHPELDSGSHPACHSELVEESHPKQKYDAIVLTVAHEQFLNINLKDYLKEGGVIYDVKGILDKNTIDKRL